MEVDGRKVAQLIGAWLSWLGADDCDREPPMLEVMHIVESIHGDVLELACQAEPPRKRGRS